VPFAKETGESSEFHLGRVACKGYIHLSSLIAFFHGNGNRCAMEVLVV
jgi:hypothetical protein